MRSSSAGRLLRDIGLLLAVLLCNPVVGLAQNQGENDALDRSEPMGPDRTHGGTANAGLRQSLQTDRNRFDRQRFDSDPWVGEQSNAEQSNGEQSDSQHSDSKRGAGSERPVYDPGLREFPRHFVESFGGVLKRRNVRFLGARLLVSLAIRPLDERVDKALNQQLGQSWAELGDALGHGQVLLPTFVGLLGISRLTNSHRFRGVAFDLSKNFLITNTIVGSMKLVTGRSRPDRTDTKSFPSGHTANAFG